MSNSARNCRNPAHPLNERRILLTDVEIHRIQTANVELCTQLSKIDASEPQTSNSTNNCRNPVQSNRECRILLTDVEISQIHSVNVEIRYKFCRKSLCSAEQSRNAIYPFNHNAAYRCCVQRVLSAVALRARNGPLPRLSTKSWFSGKQWKQKSILCRSIQEACRL